MLAMEHENATLRAELASMASLRFAVSQHITPVPAVALLAAPGGVALAGAGAGNEAPPPCGGDGDGPEALQTAIADAIARLNRLSLAASESAQAGAASGSLSPTLGTLQHCVHRVSGEFTSLLSTVSRLESEVAGLQSLRDRISFREFRYGAWANSSVVRCTGNPRGRPLGLTVAGAVPPWTLLHLLHQCRGCSVVLSDDAVTHGSSAPATALCCLQRARPAPLPVGRIHVGV